MNYEKYIEHVKLLYAYSKELGLSEYKEIEEHLKNGKEYNYETNFNSSIGPQSKDELKENGILFLEFTSSLLYSSICFIEKNETGIYKRYIQLFNTANDNVEITVESYLLGYSPMILEDLYKEYTKTGIFREHSNVVREKINFKTYLDHNKKETSSTLELLPENIDYLLTIANTLYYDTDMEHSHRVIPDINVLLERATTGKFKRHFNIPSNVNIALEGAIHFETKPLYCEENDLFSSLCNENNELIKKYSTKQDIKFPILRNDNNCKYTVNLCNNKTVVSVENENDLANDGLLMAYSFELADKKGKTYISNFIIRENGVARKYTVIDFYPHDNKENYSMSITSAENEMSEEEVKILYKIIKEQPAKTNFTVECKENTHTSKLFMEGNTLKVVSKENIGMSPEEKILSMLNKTTQPQNETVTIIAKDDEIYFCNFAGDLFRTHKNYLRSRKESGVTKKRTITD